MSYFRSVCVFWHNLLGSLTFGALGLAAALLIVLLTGCETIQPPPQKVSVPVPVSCLPSTMPVRPAIATEAELALLDDYKWTIAIYLDRRSLLDYSAELEAVLSACK
jgi:hypothetical protein